jgi:hypothetical protein
VTFTGFAPTSVARLADLPGWSSDDFADHRSELASGLVKPGGELILAVAERLDADLTVVLRSSVSPLHRDLRFAPEGADRYKDHLLLTAWEGADKRTSPVLWIRIDATHAGFASGIGFTPTIRERWRTTIVGEAGERLARLLAELVDRCGAELAGDEVERVPKPWDQDHPRADLLRKTGFQVRVVDPLPATIDQPSFVDWCTDRLGALLPVHRWLVDELNGG